MGVLFVYIYIWGDNVIYGSLTQMIGMRQAELNVADRKRICRNMQIFLLLYLHRLNQQQMQERENNNTNIRRILGHHIV